ncbi:hypothetical protein PILCRDRAFT_60840, partial [Piloderma croceum F 1598]
LLDTAYWQISQFFRYSSPTRIDEAAPYLKLILEQYDKVHQGAQGDFVPLLYLGVALHKVEGKEEDALKAFKDGFIYNELHPGRTGPNTELWAQASMSRLLRRMGKVSEAEKQEAEIRTWLKYHKFGMPPSKFRELVTDPTQQGRDYIMDQPEMKEMMRGVTELPGGISMYIG